MLPKESLKTLYFALIQPHINYGILAWGSASLSTLNKTNILQKRILRTINKVKYNTHTDPLFRKSEILKLSDLYVYNILIFMFEYCQNKLPPSFQSMFMFNHGLNTLRKTRQSDFFISDIANLHLHKNCHFIVSPLFGINGLPRP